MWEEVHHYDAQGRLVYTERGQAAERFVHDGDQKVAMLDGTGALVWQAAWGPGLDELVWWRDVQAGQGYLALGDGQKSVVGLWHQRDASLSHARSFDALGRATLWNPDESAGCEELGADEVCDWQPSQARFGFGWHSAWRSPLTGLVQMRQRWYSPGLGQFLSPDPLEYVDSHNLWAFAGQDPINGWDPFGLSSGGLTNRRPGDYDPREDAQWWNPVSNLLTALYLLQADQGIRDRMHTRRLRQKFGPQLETVDGEPFRCGVGCTVELAVEVAVHGIDTVTTPVSVVTVAPVAAKLGVRALKAGARKATGKGAQGAAKQGAKPGAAPKAGPSQAPEGKPGCKGGGCTPGPYCSFSAGTKVWMCDGSLKAVEEVEEGEYVLARDERTGEVGCKLVVGPYHNLEEAILRLSLQEEAGKVERIETTANHPFFVQGRGWQRVDALELGNQVPSATGPLLTVVALEWTARVETVYNFGVDDFHSYFVGEVGAWVHNDCDFAWEHIFDRHTPKGKVYKASMASGGSKTAYIGFTEKQIKAIVKDAWKNASKVGAQQTDELSGAVRQRYIGKPSGYSVEIEFHYNTSTKTVETAYPKGQNLVNPYMK